MPAAIAIDKIGFFLIGLSIFGLRVLFSSSSSSSNWLSIGSIFSEISQLFSWIESIISNNWLFIPIAEFPLWLAITSTKSSILPFVASRVCCAMLGHFSFIKGIKLSIFSSNHFSEITSFSGRSELSFFFFYFFGRIVSLHYLNLFISRLDPIFLIRNPYLNNCAIYIE